MQIYVTVRPGVFGSVRRGTINTVLRTAVALAAAAVVATGLLALPRASRTPVPAHTSVREHAGRTIVHTDPPHASVMPTLTPARADSAHIGDPHGPAANSYIGPQLARLGAAQAVSGMPYTSYLGSLRAAMRAETQLQGVGAAELESVITNATSIAARGLLTPSRLRVLSLTLDRNREWWTTGRLLAPYQHVEFPGSRLIWEYYPGQGIELQEQVSFSTADALCKAGPSHYAACTELLSELIPLAADRSGHLAWEYYFDFGGGVPPWTSAISQGTALQTFADAYKVTKDSLYLAVGDRALALFTAAPPSGVAVTTPLGARYVEYSFDPAPGDEVLNAFLQSLIGLEKFAHTSKSPVAARLFAAGNAEAQAELPQFDTGSWSLYKPGVEDTLAYHTFVTGLLQQLCAMTRASVYCTTASHFEHYLTTVPGR